MPPAASDRYTRCLTRMVTATMTQMREVSRRRRNIFFDRINTEMHRLLKKDGMRPSTSSYEFCSVIIIHVLLQDPKAISFSGRSRYEDRIKWALGDTILKYLRKRSKHTVIDAMAGTYPKRVIVGINLAATVRRMRTAIHACPCTWPDCSHDRFFYPFYDLIRNARREVNWRVHLAVADRLPVELDMELIIISASSYAGERSRCSIHQHLPRDYSALDNSDPCTGDSYRTYGSDNATMESEPVYTSEPEEHRWSSTDDDTFDHNDSTD
jgi:hypothetical protein